MPDMDMILNYYIICIPAMVGFIAYFDGKTTLNPLCLIQFSF